MNTLTKRAKLLALLGGFLLSPVTLPAQQDVGFIEDFALAKDRTEALKQLIPGTEDYYYYHALHFQNERNVKELDRILGEWRKTIQHSSSRKQIENRESLIRYSDDPKATLDYLKKELGLSFNHQQEGKAREANHPSSLDQNLVAWKAFLDDALRNTNNLNNLETEAFHAFLESKPNLSTDHLRALLSRATLPDLPGLTDLILTDLKSKESKGFGEFSIHRALTTKQLEQLLAAKADLINNQAYVETYLAKLLPGADENIASSPSVREAYLDRAWKFVSTLPQSFNSLKAHLLYQRLVHDRALGKMNQQRFLAYLAIPRNVSYLNPDWRKNEADAWRNPADLGHSFQNLTTLPPVSGSDESLVKSYLLEFLKNAPDSKAYAPYLSESWLRRVFAEAKITNGIGKPGDWASLLSPSEFQALKDRVDIEFDATSREVYQINDEVILPVHLKNVPKLIVKVFEINTLNYYRNLGNEISTDIDLDGLVANVVETHEYKDAPQLRTKIEFRIPSIENRRGLWVVEFIGGGKSSRALIRKGALGILNKTIGQGELVTILDENHQPLKGSSIWIGEREYKCNEAGQTLLPFSNDPGDRSAIIQDATGFATMARLRQPAENYELAAGMHLEQESLRSGGKAKIIVRPTLTLAGQTISLTKIESASLQLNSQNLDNIPASTSVPDFKLFSDRESVHEFRVPDRVTQITATLRAKVKAASQGNKEIELVATQVFKVNEALRDNSVEDFYLSKIDNKYRVEFLGRNGEPLAAQNIVVTFSHKDFKNHRTATLKTDQSGAVDLGELSDISRVFVRGPGGQRRDWVLNNDRRDQVDLLTLSQGQDLKIPFIGKLTRREVGLFSESAGGILSDEFSRLKLNKGVLVASGLTAGDYQLHLKESGQSIKIMVSGGTVSHGYTFNDTRMLELPVRQPSHISSITTKKDTLEIDVSDVDPLTRVHVIATRFVPGTDPFHALGGSQRPGLMTGQGRYLPSLYISGRNLGDELRYILERRYAKKFPGNMLVRPEILLNPWALRDTDAGEERLAGGDRFGRKPTAPAAPAAERAKKSRGGSSDGKAEPIGTPSYEFLLNDPVLVPNLVPKDGKLSIDLDAFGDRQHVHILLVDPDGSTYRSVSLPDRETLLRDLRLLNALDPKRHFTEQDRVSLLKKGESIKLPDLANSKFEVFDHLGSVHRYFLNIKNDATLREFAFITNWPALTDEEKAANYSKYACHELSFFLSRKDPDFFKKVVLPHLANKKDRTFMDDYLLEKPLEKYFEPYQYARLNVVERILLAQKDPRRLANLTLDLENRLALQTPDLGRDQMLFGAAVGGGGFGDTYAGKKVARLTSGQRIEVPASEADPFAAPGKPRALGRNSLADGIVVDEKLVRRQLKQVEAKAALEEMSLEMEFAESADAFGIVADGGILPKAEQLYRALEPTKEWAENNYYHLPIDQHHYALIDENRFWLDLAKHGMKAGFGSRHLGEATGNFHEMMLALAFLDLPFTAPEHKDEFKDGALSFTAGGSLLLFHREIKEAGMAAKRPPLLVSQSYFQFNDRFRMEDGQKIDKFITDEFIRGVVYGAQVVVTNPTSSNQRLDILTQLPKGAIPVGGQRTTSTEPVQLEPYSTRRLEIAFYFPASGKFPIYPAHLSRNGEVVAHADSVVFNVVDEPTSVDETSWAWISQWGEEDAVLKYLQTGNLHLIDLDKIAWRARAGADFHKKVLEILNARGIYHPTLQSYAIAHNHQSGIGQYLLMQGGFLNQCGRALDCELISMDPIERRNYQHLEYKPLVNNRAHALGGENRILNPVIRSHYQNFLTILSQRKSLDHIDRLGVTYYLFLQDRVDEALAHLALVDANKLETKMQYDYFQAYAAFYQADLGKARAIAKKYEKYPVDRWREKFADITNQIAEIQGADPTIIEEGNRDQEQQAIAAREPALDLKVEGVKAILDYQNVEEVTVNYYEMDLEFLFSTNPFVSSDTSRFSIIRPNESTTMKLAKGKTTSSFDLPKKYQSSNVIVEILGGGKKTSKAVYANELKTTLSENMGLLSVRHGKTQKPLSKVYVKVYARTNEGDKFFKDGYTDLRGKFDYASVSTTGLGQIQRFSILVMSEENGATVLEASVPQR